MDLEGRREFYESMVDEGQSPYLASFQSWRLYGASKMGVISLMRYLDTKDYAIVSDETDKIKLRNRAIEGILKIIASYPILLGGVISGGVTLNPWLIGTSGLTGLLMNWDGEMKICNVRDRCGELDLTWEDVFEDADAEGEEN